MLRYGRHPGKLRDFLLGYPVISQLTELAGRARSQRSTRIYMTRRNLIALFSIISVTFAAGLGELKAMDRVRVTTRTDEAVAKYGLTGKGVTIVILDRGIDWRHPDFIKPDGTTRIKWILDMTGQNGCSTANPSPVEYTEAQINAALTGGPAINHRDAVGHGTVTTGLAAGNGSAFANGRYHGMAPDADLIIVKITSDGVPAHDAQPAEGAFVACVAQALDWVDSKIIELRQPAVAIMNMGVQWGPLDGTSSESRLIDEIFGLDRPGRIYATGTGDEGGLPTHSGGTFDQNTETVVRLTKAASATSNVFAWYTGSQPAEVTLTFDDGTIVGPIAPGTFGFLQDGVTVWHYLPNGLDPWQSTSGDRLVFISITGHTVGGSFRIRGLQPGTGRFDLYTPIQSSVSFNDHLVPGRLDNFAVTRSAVVAAVEVARTSYIDIDGIPRSRSAGATGDLWTGSADGPTRDGRLGVDVTAAAHTSFAAYGPDTWWRTNRSNVIQDGGGWYGSAGAASASGPILTGAVALMLQLDPSLTAREIKEILHATAISDNFTGTTPNPHWGYGKLDMVKALDAILASLDGTDLSLRKIESPLTGGVGENFTYKFSVSNNGPDTATAVVFTHHIAAQATLISATSDHGVCNGLTEVICNLGSLNVGESGTVTIVVSAALEGEHFHVSGVVANEGDPNPANDTITAVTLVSNGPLSFTVALPEGEVGVPYNAPLQISGGAPPYSISVIKGSLPAGLDFNSPTITGTPGAAKNSSFTVKVTDQTGSSISKKLALKILKGLAIATQSLKAGRTGKSYNVTLKGTGGKGPYSWSLISGTLPLGLAFDSVTGRIIGTPTSANSSNLTFQLTDPLGGRVQKSFTLAVN